MEDSRTAPAAKPTITNPKLLLWILMVVYVLNFLDRQIVNILAEPISRDLDLSDTQIGLLTGLAFALFYTLLGIPIARYADNSSTNRVGLVRDDGLMRVGAEFRPTRARPRGRWRR
jgi:sugar phosphate permease